MTDLLEIADELYALPLASFTPERDARAKELKGSPEASVVKALRKPATGAWLVNLLVRREPAQVDQLLAVGAALREAQQAMSAGELPTLTKQRRQVTAAVVQHVRQLAAAEGHRVTEAVALQVEETLTAAMVDAECGRAVRSGLLVTGLRTTGLEPLDPAAVAAAVALPEALGFQAAPREARRIANRMRDLGGLVGIDGPLGNVLKIRPPMPFNAEHADMAVDAMSQAMAG